MTANPNPDSNTPDSDPGNPQSATAEDAVVKMFREMDVDGSGTIEVDELIHMMGADSIDYLADEVRRLFAQVDTNGDGRLDLEEFRCYMQSL